MTSEQYSPKSSDDVLYQERLASKIEQPISTPDGQEQLGVNLLPPEILLSPDGAEPVVNSSKDLRIPITAQEVKVKTEPSPPRVINLPNARVGEHYESKLEIEGFENCKSLRIEFIKGLHFSSQTLLVSGTPDEAGVLIMSLSTVEGTLNQDYEVRITVIPDPKSLWKNIASNQDGLFAKPDEDCKWLKGELFMVGASKRGRSHAHVGSFRDDDFGIQFVERSGWHIGIVADGGGSSKFSRRASQRVVNFINTELPRMLEENFAGDFDDFVKWLKADKQDSKNAAQAKLYKSILTVSFNAAKKLEEDVNLLNAEVIDGSSEPSYSIKDFNTTLILCVAKKSKHGWFIGSFSIGDGGAVVLDIKNKKATLMTTGDSGEFAGQTRFLSTSEFNANLNPSLRLHHCVSEAFDSIVLMTDGVTDPFFATDTDLQNFDRWLEFWTNNIGATVNLSSNNSETPIQMLDWLNFWSPGNHDDRTIVLLRNSGGYCG